MRKLESLSKFESNQLDNGELSKFIGGAATTTKTKGGTYTHKTTGESYDYCWDCTDESGTTYCTDDTTLEDCECDEDG